MSLGGAFPFVDVRRGQDAHSAGGTADVADLQKLMRRQRRRSIHHGDAVLHRLLYLREGTHAYLAHALMRDAELVGELLEGDRLFGEPTRLEDASLALIEHGERVGQGLAAVVEFLARRERGLLVRGFVHQPVLPLSGSAVVADQGVERGVAPEPPVHVDHVRFADAELLGDDPHLVQPHIAIVEDGDFALGLA